jgi:hypothetical protein
MGSIFDKAKDKVVHINCTLPTLLKNKSDEFVMTDEEVLAQVLSLMSMKYYTKKKNILFTDVPGFKFYDKIGLLSFYDEVDVDVVTLFTEDIKTDHESFFVSAKTFGLYRLEPPFMFFDLDFILKQEIPESYFKNDIVYAHNEILRKEHIYSLQDLQKYGLYPDFDFDETAMMPNVCFVYMNNKELQKIYENENLYIIQKKYETDVPKWLFLHSEQGCLGQILHKNIDFKADILSKKTFLQFPTTKDSIVATPSWVVTEDYKPENDVDFYHIWGKKNEIFTNQGVRTKCYNLLYDFVYNKGMEEFLKLGVVKYFL